MEYIWSSPLIIVSNVTLHAHFQLHGLPLFFACLLHDLYFMHALQLQLHASTSPLLYFTLLYFNSPHDPIIRPSRPSPIRSVRSASGFRSVVVRLMIADSVRLPVSDCRLYPVFGFRFPVPDFVAGSIQFPVPSFVVGSIQLPAPYSFRFSALLPVLSDCRLYSVAVSLATFVHVDKLVQVQLFLLCSQHIDEN